MADESRFYMVRGKALPEVLLKVDEANRLLHSQEARTVAEAIRRVGISRSAYYKYKDDIFRLHEKLEGKILTFVMEMEDRPGLLSGVLSKISASDGNVLTIYQSIPVNGRAMVTLSVRVLPSQAAIPDLIEQIEQAKGIHSLKMVSGESYM